MPLKRPENNLTSFKSEKTMDVKIKPVTGIRELKLFISFPYSLYDGNAFWVPPLRFTELQTFRRDKNPAFEFCEVKYWLAFNNGKVVGRIAGIINTRYIETWGNKALRFGYLEFIDNEKVSDALLNTVENWAKEKGMQSVHGPLGFTDLDPEGMLVEGFEELGTMGTIYNFPYYPVHLEKNGYQKDVDWVEFEVKVPAGIHERLKRLAEAAARRNHLRVLQVESSKELLPYAKEIFHVLNESYKGLYGVVPLTEKQIDMYVDQYFRLIRHDYISVILDREGRVAAFGITIPSLASALQKARGRLFPFGFFHLLRALRKNDTVEMCLIAVRPDLQGKGVNAVLMHEFNKIYVRHNIIKAETNPELETNSRVQAQWKFFDARRHKRRRCYIKYV
jgi:GNAT superfamily N-acetyltransferase